MIYEVRSGLLGTLIRADTTVDNVTTVVASTPAEDSMDDVVIQDWRLARFKSNPVILWSHNGSTPPVGRAERISTPKDTGNLTALIRWDIGDHNPLGTTIGTQFSNKMLNAVSVGFRPGKRQRRNSLNESDPAYKPDSHGLVLSRNLLLEISAVGIPANSEALAIRSWATEAETEEEQLERYLTETNTKKLSSWLLGVIRSDKDIRLALTSLLLSEIPTTDSGGLSHLFEE